MGLSTEQLQVTTVRMPRDLYEQARTAVRKGGVAASMNDFLVDAVQEKLRHIRGQEIDNAFAEMGQDEEYQKEALALARSFESSDWEAYQVANAASNRRSPKKRTSRSTSR